TSVCVAQMDEISFTVSSIAKDGTVSLRPRGTFFRFLWEGQPALLHRDNDRIPGRDGRLGCGTMRDGPLRGGRLGRGAVREGPLRGGCVPRDSSAQREPATLTAWFGRDSAELAASGVGAGARLTGAHAHA